MAVATGLGAHGATRGAALLHTHEQWAEVGRVGDEISRVSCPAARVLAAVCTETRSNQKPFVRSTRVTTLDEL